MKRIIPLITLFAVCACTFSEIQPLSSPSPIPENPTPTPSPVPTLKPTETLPPPTPTPPPAPVIGAQNISRLGLMISIPNPYSRKVVFSPDGSLFAVASGNDSNYAVKIWKTDSGELVQSLNQFTGIVWDIAFSPDSQYIVSVADDQNKESVRIWQVPDGQLVVTLNNPETANSVAFSPDGSTLAAGGISGWPNGVIWLYGTSNWSSIRPLTVPDQNVLALKFFPGGDTLVSGGTDGKIRFWRTSDGYLLRTLFHDKQLNGMALAPDGRLLASTFCSKNDSYGCTTGGVAIWSVDDGSVLQLFDDLAESLAFSPDGRILASGSMGHEQIIRLRNVSDWSLLNALSSSAASIAFAPGQAYLATVDNEFVKLWGVK